MRNVFNQYSQAENRLSHALASTLAHSADVCRAFLSEFANKKVSKRASIKVVEQTIPGSYEPISSGVERGLPDICVAVEGEWCLAIESKVGSRLDPGQLTRHRRTVEHAYPTVVVLAITARSGEPAGPSANRSITWRHVYLWLGQGLRVRNFWCLQLREFMRDLQALLCEDESNMPDSITEFDGIRFNDDHPYNYLEAKMLIKGLMPELRRHALMKKMLIDVAAAGRPSITGSKGAHVWDFLMLTWTGAASARFTANPHFSMGIGVEVVDAMLTFPNNLHTSYRHRLRIGGFESFMACCEGVVDRYAHSFGKLSGVSPMLRLSQRHYLGQIKSVQDADINVDLRVGTGNKNRKIKPNSTWIKAAYDMMCEPKGANLQMEVGVWFSHREGALSGAEATDQIARAFCCTEPFSDFLRKSSATMRG